MKRINNYKFGYIEIDDNSFTADLIVFPTSIEDEWWRAESHNLVIADIEKYNWNDIEIVVIGTGEEGLMKVSNSLKQFFTSYNTKTIICCTPDAVIEFNNLKTEKKAALLHLTC